MRTLLQVSLKNFQYLKAGTLKSAVRALSSGISLEFALFDAAPLPALNLLRFLDREKRKDGSFNVEECLNRWIETANSALGRLDQIII